jgi:hypothetical protein
VVSLEDQILLDFSRRGIGSEKEPYDDPLPTAIGQHVADRRQAVRPPAAVASPYGYLLTGHV